MTTHTVERWDYPNGRDLVSVNGYDQPSEVQHGCSGNPRDLSDWAKGRFGTLEQQLTECWGRITFSTLDSLGYGQVMCKNDRTGRKTVFTFLPEIEVSPAGMFVHVLERG
jgi:hypothetical protein